MNPANDNMEVSLREDAALGLDRSPGNPVSAWAVREIDTLRVELAALKERQATISSRADDLIVRGADKLIAENDALKAELAAAREDSAWLQVVAKEMDAALALVLREQWGGWWAFIEPAIKARTAYRATIDSARGKE